MNSYKRLKDPIYGYISISNKIIHNIVDTAEFQRLRRVIQTSYSPLYSSAVHNRFVHSLGVYHLGDMASQQLVAEFNENSNFESMKEEIDRFRELFLLACLLHDVGHAPFSHTGENMYLDGEGENRYVKIHNELKEVVDSEEFEKDVPLQASKSAAAHEIMSVIVGIRKYGQYFENDEERSFFARCILGYIYSDKSRKSKVKNCFISLLNSKVIDVDKLDYLIRDAYITGFYTVNIDYERLLKSITIIDYDDDIKLAYNKNAISVIENVVYAHDSERKWIQTHPVVLYESYLLRHIFQYICSELDNDKQKLFSYKSLTPDGQIFICETNVDDKKILENIKVSLMCDDDIIYIMKNILPSDFGKEFFERKIRRHPLWKSEAEYEALFSGTIGKKDSMQEFEDAMNATATYLSKNTDSWKIDKETLQKVKNDINGLEESNLDNETIKAQKKEKEKVIRLMNCLIQYAESNNHDSDFVILEAKQFLSGFDKPDFHAIPIIFNTSKDTYLDCEFEEVVRPLKAEKPERNNFYYLFYRREMKDDIIDKKNLCEYLAKEFTTLNTHTISRR